MRSQFINFIFYLILQIFIAKYFTVFSIPSFFIYIAFLLMLPIKGNLILFLCIGFLTGLTIDVFYDSLGIHAFAAVLMVYVRSFLIKLTFSPKDEATNSQITLRLMGFQRFTLFALIPIVIHHTTVFFLETHDSALSFIAILGRVGLSVIFTYVAVLITQIIFYTYRKNRTYEFE